MTVTMHTDAEIARAWTVLDDLYAELSHNPRVAGARAAEWTTGRIPTSPIRNTAQEPTGEALVWEAAAADMIATGSDRGDRNFAAGAAAWLFWFVGIEPLPRWLR